MVSVVTTRSGSLRDRVLSGVWGTQSPRALQPQTTRCCLLHPPEADVPETMPQRVPRSPCLAGQGAASMASPPTL